jgi:hypothetical protein
MEIVPSKLEIDHENAPRNLQDVPMTGRQYEGTFQASSFQLKGG